MECLCCLLELVIEYRVTAPQICATVLLLNAAMAKLALGQ